MKQEELFLSNPKKSFRIYAERKIVFQTIGLDIDYSKLMLSNQSATSGINTEVDFSDIVKSKTLEKLDPRQMVQNIFYSNLKM